MKLSAALMLGSVLGEKPTNHGTWDNCLIGVACHALGVKGTIEEYGRRWPWLNSDVMSEWGPVRGYVFVTALCGRVQYGRISIQQAAEIIATVEPQDIQGEQADEGQETRIAVLEATEA